ncbi:hypothetical protein N7492_004366 [Penicillium capsulatum]|uniref:RING-type domain-containing protein n=1 Tax=Penicillium capsulatum TaxID=69766 RepID=A0A9W9LR31_9EURO|nr:hypothetical protein N7492_004366 [Penicillium capsulatum]KAJ6136515.1 hypothetical protein N7512_001675 [Penicillium capsulatum]
MDVICRMYVARELADHRTRHRLGRFDLTSIRAEEHRILSQPIHLDMHLVTEYRALIEARHATTPNTVNAIMAIITRNMDSESDGFLSEISENALACLPRQWLEQGMFGTDGDQLECSICMGAVAIEDEVIQLSCQHWFHPDCLTRWLRVKSSCPFCRQRV